MKSNMIIPFVHNCSQKIDIYRGNEKTVEYIGTMDFRDVQRYLNISMETIKRETTFPELFFLWELDALADIFTELMKNAITLVGQGFDSEIYTQIFFNNRFYNDIDDDDLDEENEDDDDEEFDDFDDDEPFPEDQS